MTFRSNIQASRISRGVDWKNLWIPNYNRLYTKYFINDHVISRYVKLKFYNDDKLNWTYTYYYDFFVQKTFNQTFLFLKKYNVDFSRLTQAGYFGKLNTLFDGLSGLINTNFYIMADNAPDFVNFFFQPQAYYFYFLARHTAPDFWIFEIKSLEKNLSIDQIFLAKLFSNSLFLSKSVFSTKTNFFDTDNFEILNNFFYDFIPYNISFMPDGYVKPKYIYQDKFWLANFLLNPMLLNKYPNFIFFYNNWLHKSWQLSKWKILQSLKLVQYGYNHTTPITLSVDYFFAKYVRFFFFMRELNVFFQGQGAGVGITHEFLAKQVETLMLKIRIWETMYSKIKEIWFYIKAYLKYFSYEGKVNLNWSRFFFKRLFSFWKLLKSSIAGIQLNTPALITFIKIFYFNLIKREHIFSCLNVFFIEGNFLTTWYKFISWSFFKSLKILKIILRTRKLSIFTKLNLLHALVNTFCKKILKKNRFSFTLLSKPKLANTDLFFPNINLSLNGLFTLILTQFNFKLFHTEKKIPTAYFLKCSTWGFFPISNLKLFIDNKHRSIKIYDSIINVKQSVKHSDWFSIIIFNPTILLNFLLFSFKWKLEWKKKFIYFHYIISNLTPKIFFWIFTDLSSLSHFSVLLHLAIIYWQNFFFFYLFVLKCLKWMYSLCSKENLLFLSQPIWTFLQRSRSHTTLLDLFSSSVWKFLSLGLNCLYKNITIGDQRTTFSLSDLASTIANFGKPNCWRFTTGNTYVYKNKFSTTEINSMSPFFVPFISIWFSSKTFYNKNALLTNDKKNWLTVNLPFFAVRVPTHLIIKHYSNLMLSASLIALFIKKKLEREHLLAEVLRSLNLLTSQAEMIKGFMFLIKGRFSRRERASKVWLKKGKLNQTMLWTKLDYCKLPVILKYGCASVWVWLVLNNNINDLNAII